MRLSVGLALCCLCTAVFAADPAHAALRKDTSIPAEGLGAALQTLANTYDFQVLYKTEVVRGLRTQGAAGSLTSDEALTKVLGGTGLSYKYLDANTVTVYSPSSSASATGVAQSQSNSPDSSTKEGSGKKSSRDFRVAQVDQGQAQAGPSIAKSAGKKNTAVLEEVVVTGTNIRGSDNPASPVQTFSRGDIARTGLATVKDFMQSLPQNFNGVANENTNSSLAGGPASGQNVSGGSAFNLRGLGPGATLTLIDGHRVAGGNIQGNWTDISSIPLAAVERIEVLTDGASATYGSDAVGGVVNLIMRKGFEGSETGIRYGKATDGGDREIQASQSVGHEWTGGSAVLTYEYLDRTPVFASDRSFTDSAAEPTTLLPQQVRNSAFIALQQDVGNLVTLFGEGNYSKRSGMTANSSEPGDFMSYYNPTVSAYSGTGGGRVRLPSDNTLEVTGTYARSITQVQYVVNYLGQPSPTPEDNTSTGLTSADAKIDGPLWHIASGTIRYAAGAQFRRETFQTTGNNSSPNQTFNLARHVSAGFLELDIPVLGPRSGGGPNRLELELAGRTEKYSDVGSTTNPKVGVVWRAFPELRARGTFGTSFQAPALWALNPSPYSAFILPEADPLTGGTTNSLIIAGGNPDLLPEKATTWTAGLDWKPEYIPGLNGNLTYYNIHFRHEITDANSAGYNVFNALAIESQLGSAIVRRNPSTAEIQQLIASSAQFTDLTGTPGGAPLSSVGAFIDVRELNLSDLKTDGLELELSYSTEWGALRSESGINGAYILSYDQRLLPTSNAISILDTPYNPVNLRARAREILGWGNWTLAAFVNYVNSYADNRIRPSVPVAPWTTEDLTVGYKFGGQRGLLSDLSILASVVNLADKKPPYVLGYQATTFPGINFDGTNANALGRVVSIQVSKSF